MGDTYNQITGAKVRQSSIVVKSLEFQRPANTTAYTIGDAVAPDVLTITAASNATPIVITSTAHGLATDDRVTIAAVGGNTNANGDWKVRVLTANTFSLYTEAGVASAGNAAYTSGGTAQKMLRLADVVASLGAGGSIIGLQFNALSATVTLGTFRFRFYNAPVSQIADNAAWTLLYSNRAKRVAQIDASIVQTDGAGSDTSEVNIVPSQPIPFVCNSARADLFVQIVALGAYVPASAETFRLVVTIRRDQPSQVTLR